MYRGYRFPKSRNIWDRLERKPEHQRIWAGDALAEDKDALLLTPADFLGCNSFVDYEIGRVLAAIDAHAPETLVVYTADHGEMLSGHSLCGKGPAMYDEITRIPLLVRWPGIVPAGSVYLRIRSRTSISPPRCWTPRACRRHACWKAWPLPRAARPLPPRARCRLPRVGRYEIDHDGFGGFQPIRAACDGRYKLVITCSLLLDELKDLQQDPEEMDNLLDTREYAARRDRLHDRLASPG